MTRKNRGRNRKLSALDFAIAEKLNSLAFLDSLNTPDVTIIDREIQLLILMQQHQCHEQAATEAHNRAMFEDHSEAETASTVCRKRKSLYNEDRDEEPDFKRSRVNDIIMSVLEQRPQSQVHRPRSASTPPPNVSKQQDSSSTSTVSQAHTLHLLPNEIQQMIYGHAIRDEGSMIALIYASKTVRNNTLKAVCLTGSHEIMSEAVDVLQYRMATKSAPWPREWRARWGEPLCQMAENTKNESMRMDSPRSGNVWFW